LHTYSAIGLLTTKGSTLLVLVALMMVTFSASPIKAQLATTIPKAPAPTPASPSASASEVVVSVFGVTKPSGTIVTFVTVKNGSQNVTKGVVDDAMTLDKKDGRVDGVAQMFFRIGNATMTLGSEIKACAIVIKDLSIVCGTAHKAPDPRTDIQLDIGSAANLKKIT
jgi:hypothetical protein